MNLRADVNAEDTYGKTPLHIWAKWAGRTSKPNFAIAEVLISHGADLDITDSCGKVRSILF
ncbi:MAG TPA: hypothetical protein VKP88_08365 [Candidatus Paceibacterota bacterium]|nr:hypothetical protein [Candidatus Paceibacterota bacterium]